MPHPPLPQADLDHVLEHVGNLWDELKGARLFITGGTGFVGSWLLESLAEADRRLGLGLRAVVLTRNPEGFLARMPHLRGGPVSFLQGDVRNFGFPTGGFSHVIHAGTTSGSPVPHGEMFDTITLGTRRVLEFSIQSEVRNFLFLSSGAVYGRQPANLEQIPETYFGAPDPIDPASAYGEGKRAAEWLCANCRQEHGLAVKIARCFAFAGPHLPLDAHFAVGNFIRDAMKGGPIRVAGDGTSVRSYLYAADMAVWLWTVLLKGAPGGCYNVGSDEPVTIAGLARTIAEVLGPGLSVHLAQASQSAVSSRYLPDCRRARELGLGVRIPLEDQIKRTADWLRSVNH